MQQAAHAPTTAVEPLAHFAGPDLHDLSDAADAAIQDGGGFGWLTSPPRDAMVGYWKGVLLVPERELFVARLDGTICGSAQLLRPSRSNEAGAAVGTLTTFFLAPWARGHGLAAKLVLAAEGRARAVRHQPAVASHRRRHRAVGPPPLGHQPPLRPGRGPLAGRPLLLQGPDGTGRRMILFPAIDLKQGQVVRLYKGAMEQATVYGDDPAAQAARFQALGFSWLHLVDLGGAFAARHGGEHERPRPAHARGIRRHDVEIGADMRRKVRLVDDE